MLEVSDRCFPVGVIRRPPQRLRAGHSPCIIGADKHWANIRRQGDKFALRSRRQFRLANACRRATIASSARAQGKLEAQYT
jgi:hypothetical protein